jgi:hypothetical protein
MVNEIAQNILSSSNPNALFTMSTTNALKISLYREKKKLNPFPPIPRTEQDAMNINTTNGSQFLILNSLINDMELCV